MTNELSDNLYSQYETIKTLTKHEDKACKIYVVRLPTSLADCFMLCFQDTFSMTPLVTLYLASSPTCLPPSPPSLTWSIWISPPTGYAACPPASWTCPACPPCSSLTTASRLCPPTSAGCPRSPSCPSWATSWSLCRQVWVS